MKGGVSMLAEKPYKLTSEYNNNKMKYISGRAHYGK